MFSLEFFVAFLFIFFVSGEELCRKNVSLDVLFAIDNTVSMDIYIQTVKQFVETSMEKFQSSSVSSQFGLLSFNSKKVYYSKSNHLGITYYEKRNYAVNWTCQVKYNGASSGCPMIISSLNSDKKILGSSLETITCHGGSYDGSQDAIGALLMGTNPKISWRDPKKLDQTKTQYGKVIFLITDSYAHLPAEQCGGLLTPMEDNYNYDCEKHDVPSKEKVAEVLNRFDAILYIVTTSTYFDFYNLFFDNLKRKPQLIDIQSLKFNIEELLTQATQYFRCKESPTESMPIAALVNEVQPLPFIGVRDNNFTSSATISRPNLITRNITGTPASVLARKSLVPLPVIAVVGGLALFGTAGFGTYALKHTFRRPILIEGDFDDLGEYETGDKNQKIELNDTCFA